uniref:Uncharacterized protein n=1 Tax=Anopheles farauti TaxID=69004 RepID=A0A182Q905_9DIPT
MGTTATASTAASTATNASTTTNTSSDEPTKTAGAAGTTEPARSAGTTARQATAATTAATRLERCEIVQVRLVHHHHVLVLLVRIAKHVLPHVRRLQLTQRHLLVLQILLVVAHIRDRQTVTRVLRVDVDPARRQLEEVLPHPRDLVDQIPARYVVRVAVVFGRRRLDDRRHHDRVVLVRRDLRVHLRERVLQHRVRHDVAPHRLQAGQLRRLELVVGGLRLLQLLQHPQAQVLLVLLGRVFHLLQIVGDRRAEVAVEVLRQYVLHQLVRYVRHRRERPAQKRAVVLRDRLHVVGELVHPVVRRVEIELVEQIVDQRQQHLVVVRQHVQVHDRERAVRFEIAERHLPLHAGGDDQRPHLVQLLLRQDLQRERARLQLVLVDREVAQHLRFVAARRHDLDLWVRVAWRQAGELRIGPVRFRDRPVTDRERFLRRVLLRHHVVRPDLVRPPARHLAHLLDHRLVVRHLPVGSLFHPVAGDAQHQREQPLIPPERFLGQLRAWHLGVQRQYNLLVHPVPERVLATVGQHDDHRRLQNGHRPCPYVSMPDCIRFRLSKSNAFFSASPIDVKPLLCRFFSSFMNVAWFSFQPAFTLFGGSSNVSSMYRSPMQSCERCRNLRNVSTAPFAMSRYDFCTPFTSARWHMEADVSTRNTIIVILAAAARLMIVLAWERIARADGGSGGGVRRSSSRDRRGRFELSNFGKQFDHERFEQIVKQLLVVVGVLERLEQLECALAGVLRTDQAAQQLRYVVLQQRPGRVHYHLLLVLGALRCGEADGRTVAAGAAGAAAGGGRVTVEGRTARPEVAQHAASVRVQHRLVEQRVDRFAQLPIDRLPVRDLHERDEALAQPPEHAAQIEDFAQQRVERLGDRVARLAGNTVQGWRTSAGTAGTTLQVQGDPVGIFRREIGMLAGTYRGTVATTTTTTTRMPQLLQLVAVAAENGGEGKLRPRLLRR